MITALTLLSIAGILYAYAGYPLILNALVGRGMRTKLQTTGPIPGSVSIIIAARNEASVIAEKLENTLSLEIPDSLSMVEIVVASDASDDGMDEVVSKGYANRGVIVSRSPERKGKEFAQALTAAKCRGEIILFTDAKVRLSPDALRNVLPYFRDASVGAVSSVDKVDGDGSGEGMYVQYEMWLRSLESEFYSLVGLSGSCFAVRRELCATMRTDIPSDFSLLLEAQHRNLRGVSAPDVLCWYRAVKSEEEEFQRKVRTVLRGITALMVCSSVLNPKRYGKFAWQIFSHKLMRWLVPWFLVVATLGTFILADESLIFLLGAYGAALFYLLALLGYAKPEFRNKRWVKIPLFFLVTNAAIAVSWVRFFRGQRAVTWQPSAKPKI